MCTVLHTHSRFLVASNRFDQSLLISGAYGHQVIGTAVRSDIEVEFLCAPGGLGCQNGYCVRRNKDCVCFHGFKPSKPHYEDKY